MSSRSPDRHPVDIRGLFEGAGLSGNTAHVIPLGNERVVLKIYGAKKPRSTYRIRLFLCRMGIRQPIEYRTPQERQDFERTILEHWKHNGYAVPDILPSPFTEYTHIPHLVTRWISGEALQDILCKSTGFSSWKDTLEQLFFEMESRHQQALAGGDANLCHIDANARNILVSDDRIYHVDFEMGRPWEPAGTWACREVLKLLISICDDIATEERPDVLTLFRRTYHLETVLNEIRRSIIARPFRRFHRWRNQRKKEKAPNRATLYDLGEALW